MADAPPPNHLERVKSENASTGHASKAQSPEKFEEYYTFAGMEHMDDATWTALVQQHEPDIQASVHDLNAQIEKASALVEAAEQRVRTLLEQRFLLECSIGPAEPPAHMAKNIFDDLIPLKRESEPDCGSPDAMTLVDLARDGGPASPTQESLLEQSTVAECMPYADLNYADQDSTSETVWYSNLSPDETTITFSEPRKRKRFSKHSATKKARTDQLQGDGEQLGVSPSPTEKRTSHRRRKEALDCKPTMLAQTREDDSGKEPVPSSRPTSWPRTRLFRRSAGLSVRKLTEVFEKMRVQH